MTDAQRRTPQPWIVAAAALSLLCSGSQHALGLALINELYYDPPTSAGDATHEYIELRGTPGMSLDNHYLIFLESEGDGSIHVGDQGSIDEIFDLTGRAFGSNGFLSLRQKGSNPLYGPYTIAPGTTDLVNAGSGVGFGSNTIAAPTSSSIGASISGANGRIENGAFTAMLIRNDGNPLTNKPVLDIDLDLDNNGLDIVTGKIGWTILDSIGVFSEVGETEQGRSYAPVTFGKDSIATIPDLVYADHVPAGGVYVPLEFELEYLGRWGNSAGNAAANWDASNLTDNSDPGGAGFTHQGDFRQSGDPHPPGPTGITETSHGVPYGTILTNTIGAPNYPLNSHAFTPGDFDADGDVDATDLNVEWVRRLGADLTGDDFLRWQRNLAGTPAVAIIAPVPEPASALLGGLLLAALGASCRGRRG